MSIEIVRDVVQPLGDHNPEQSCVRTECVSHLVKYNFSHFNPMQSSVIEILTQDCNVVISSPTASGKTIPMELFSAYALEQNKHSLCLFPLKALTEEKLDDWKDPSHTFSTKKIIPVTGDYVLTPAMKEELFEADIIVATSEMLDSKTRTYSSNAWLNNIGVLVVDEAHLIGSQSRGPRLESAIMRFGLYNPNARIILMSATVPNASDLVEWLSNVNGKKTVLIRSDYRPCILNTHYIRFDDCLMSSRSNYERIERLRMNIVRNQIEKNMNDQHIVFVGNKFWGYEFKKFMVGLGYDAEFHNADYGKDQRKLIENKFRNGEIRYLVSTSTLSWGCYKFGSKVKMWDGSLKNIEDIVVGDYVVSLDGYIPKDYKILKVGTKHFDKSLKFTTESGHTCEVSKDHLFLYYTPLHETITKSLLDGDTWVEAKDLNIGDEIYVVNFIEEEDEEKTLFRTRLMNDCISFPSKIVNIEESDGGDFQDIEVEYLHNYIGEGFLSHNCNLPARRVILAHTSYGLSPMEICDIDQSKGRSGRPKYDKEGDAYIVLAASQYEQEKTRLESGFKIQSQICTVPNLAFNLVSEVMSGTIKNKDDFYNWYQNTLSFIQNQHVTKSDCDSVFSLLEEKKMIEKKINDDGSEFYDVTQLGKITSVMYFNPLDIYDWFMNFSKVERLNPNLALSKSEIKKADIAVCHALANCYEYRKNRPYISKNELNTSNVNDFLNDSGKKPDGVSKIAACYYALINGKEVDTPLKSVADLLKLDLKRILAAMRMIQERYGRNIPNIKGFQYNPHEWDILYYRIVYGVGIELCPLVAINGIGREYAKKLYSVGVRNKDDFLKKEEASKSILGEKRFKNIASTLKQL